MVWILILLHWPVGGELTQEQLSPHATRSACEVALIGYREANRTNPARLKCVQAAP
jgi:hypothetical protein